MTIETNKKIIINENFEKHINDIRVDTKETALIPFKLWTDEKKYQKVYKVPIEYCRYRVENGRIRTETLSYETTKKSLNQDLPEDQKIIGDFLSKSDPSRNEELMNSLKRDGQNDPAVITADGFLINGNRRKWALGKLNEKFPGEKFQQMKVVILPGSDNPEAPTIQDIALLENRYQVNITGKSEYTIMNKALTFRFNVNNGIPLKQLLRDDANYSDLSEKDFNREAKKFEKDHFEPLNLIDEYLALNKMKGDYEKIAHRWESFKELNQKVITNLNNDKYLTKYKLEPEDVGNLRSACYNIIKLKDPKELGKNRHTDLIREINTWVDVSKKDFLKLGEIEDISINIKDPDERDREWQHTRGDEIINGIKKLQALANKKEMQEGPIDRLEEVLRKLDHKHLDEEQIKRMPIDEIETAIKLTNDIQTANKGLQKTFYDLKKNRSPKALKKHFENR